jgi:hypothetical protein
VSRAHPTEMSSLHVYGALSQIVSMRLSVGALLEKSMRADRYPFRRARSSKASRGAAQLQTLRTSII